MEEQQQARSRPSIMPLLLGIGAFFVISQVFGGNKAVKRKAVLNRSSLRGMDLSGMKLQGAKITGCDFRQSNLTNADLGEAQLNGVHLAGANLRDADLEGVVLKAVKFNKKTILPDGSAWNKEADLERFTNPEHPEFWRSPSETSPAFATV